MNEYLNGSVKISRLTSDPDERGRFLGGDERGIVAMIASNEPFMHIEFVEFSGPEVVRGKHYHELFHERLCVLTGHVKLFAATIRDDGSADNPVSIDLPHGSCVDIAPGTGHVFVSAAPSFTASVGNGPNSFEDRYPYDPDLTLRDKR